MQNLANPTTRSSLLTSTATTVDALDALLARHAAAEQTTASDAAGWTTKDHLAHVAAWYRSVLLPARDGISRSHALGVSEAVFATRSQDDFYALNDEIRRLYAGESLATVVDGLHTVVAETQAFIASASDDDLQRRIEACDPADGEVPVADLLREDGWMHLDEHRGYIAPILGDR